MKKNQIVLIIIALILVALGIYYSGSVYFGPKVTSYVPQFDPNECSDTWIALDACDAGCEAEFCKSGKNRKIKTASGNGLATNCDTDSNPELSTCVDDCWQLYGDFIQGNNCGPWPEDEGGIFDRGGNTGDAGI